MRPLNGPGPRRWRYSGDRYGAAIEPTGSTAPAALSRRPAGVSLLRRRRLCGRWRCIAAELLREFRRRRRPDPGILQNPPLRGLRSGIHDLRSLTSSEELSCSIFTSTRRALFSTWSLSFGDKERNTSRADEYARA